MMGFWVFCLCEMSVELRRAIGTTKHNRAVLVPAKFPQTNQPPMRAHDCSGSGQIVKEAVH